MLLVATALAASIACGTSSATDGTNGPCPAPSGENHAGCSPPCPEDVTAIAQPDGSILVNWSAVAGADEYRVYRNTGIEPFGKVHNTTGLSFLDTNATAGVTHQYIVTAVDDGVESGGCTEIAATAVPFFGGLVGGAAALAGSLGIFAWLRRRRWSAPAGPRGR